MSRGTSTEKQRALELQRESETEALNRAFAYVMGSPHGRLFVRYLLLLSGVDGEAMTGNSQTFHTLGKQAVGRDVRNALRSKHRTEWRLLEDEAFRDADTIAAIHATKDE